MTKNIWVPQTKQRIAMSRGEDEMLYGGAAGGGKSDWLVVEATRQVKIPLYRGLILRKSVPELAQLIEKSYNIYPKIDKKAKYNDNKHTWTFKSGAKIQFGSLYHTKDKYKYQGLQYDFIGFDELTQFIWDEYSYLRSRNRSNCKETKVYSRATANPGGIGHGWVKQYFVEAGKPYETVWTDNVVIMPDGTKKKFWNSKCFIPASVFDNPALLENDPMYIARLAQMNEHDRNALLYGSWDSFSGQVFTEWVDNREHYRDKRYTHVIEPFKIPWGWRIIRGFDWGYTKPFSVGWWAVDNDGRYYRIREAYGCKKGEPNVGIQMKDFEVAQMIREIENSDPNLKGRQIYGVADPAIFAETGSGESIAAVHARYQVAWNKGDHERIAGKMQIHNRLAFDDDGVPMLYVFNTCKDFIRTMPNLVYSETKVEDIDTDTEDHIYDETRYVCMENMIAPRTNVLKQVSEFDPLDVYKTNRIMMR